MDWNDLASNDLPILQLQFPRRNNNAISTEGLGSSLLLGDGINTNISDAIISRNDTTPTDMFDIPRRSVPSLEEMIQRHERGLLSSLLQGFSDETRQKTKKAVDDQLEDAWEKEKALFVKDSMGESNYRGNAGIRSAEFLVSSPFYSLTSSENFIKPDASLVLDHWKVVERITLQNLNESIDQFSRLARDFTFPNKLPSMIAYSSAWRLVASLVEASISPVDQAKAILSHFCKQFHATVTNRVLQASLVGQATESTFSNDVTAHCATFARLSVGNTDPWTICYYCLRCGDAIAALSALEKVQTGASIQQLLSSMARVQGTAACFWDIPASHLCFDSEHQLAVRSLLDSFNESDKLSNMHKIAVLTLLSAGTAWPFNFESSEGFNTIEDFLTGSLWIAVVRSNPIDHLIELRDVILKLGPSYFDDPSSGGWAYALPLFATQQYHKALVLLAEVGGLLGLLQAAHMGLVLSLSGIPIRNLGYSASVDDVLANLLVAYSRDILKGYGPLASLDYFAKIPNKVRGYKEVAVLIATSEDIGTLVGTLNAEGIRENGALAKLFSNKEVSTILVEASDLLYASGGDKQKIGSSVMCLMLAERYDNALSVLNRLLTPPNAIDDSRHFWLEQVSLFHTHYINKRTHVLDVLESSGKSSLIRTSRILMELNLFFDRLRIGNNTSECLSIAQKTNLLPITEADRNIKESEYYDLDPLLQESIPLLLVGVMEILSNDYNHLKKEIHRDTSGVVRERLKELKENARLLTTYGSSLGISNDMIGILTQLMSLMI